MNTRSIAVMEEILVVVRQPIHVPTQEEATPGLTPGALKTVMLAIGFLALYLAREYGCGRRFIGFRTACRSSPQRTGNRWAFAGQEEIMKELVEGRTRCLFDSHVGCDRMRVAQREGLHAIYFREGGSDNDAEGKSEPSDPRCHQCSRNGSRLR